MLKFSLLLSLLILISCGKDKPVEEPTKMGVRFQLQEELVADANVLQKIGAICESLVWKAQRLQVGSQYTFSYVHKGCDDRSTGQQPDVNVTVKKLVEVFTFVPNDNNTSFPFTEVETRQSGSLQQICDDYDRGALYNPYVALNKDGVYFSTSSVEQCQPDSEHVCIELDRASLVTGRTYEVHTTEVLKIKIKNERKGFFVGRMIRSIGDCAPGKNIESSVALK